MKFIDLNEFIDFNSNTAVCKDVRDWDSDIIRVGQEAGVTANDELTKLLKQIGKSKVEEMHVELGTYKADGKNLGISSLSTGEKIFTLAYLYNMLQKNIMFIYGIRELSINTFKLFMSTFKDSKFISIGYYDSQVIDGLLYLGGCYDKSNYR